MFYGFSVSNLDKTGKNVIGGNIFAKWRGAIVARCCIAY